MAAPLTFTFGVAEKATLPVTWTGAPEVLGDSAPNAKLAVVLPFWNVNAPLLVQYCPADVTLTVTEGEPAVPSNVTGPLVIGEAPVTMASVPLLTTVLPE